MSRLWCNECKKPITPGIYDYSMDVFHKSLCFECQKRAQRYLDITSGKLKVEYEKISKCVRCGGELSEEDRKKLYCDSCSKKINTAESEQHFLCKSCGFEWKSISSLSDKCPSCRSDNIQHI
jgi:predicted RNA-binding Zn-ribbon protein involved in translation (DUF1610 family)